MAEELLSTAQAARYLGVKAQTVYAYVSRGRLTPAARTTTGGRQVSWYRVDDVERLRAGAGRAATRAPVIQTRITAIEDDDRLLFRGRPVEDLADRLDPERLCELLWQADGPLSFGVDEGVLTRLRAAVDVLPPGAQPIDRMRLVVLLLGAADPHRHDLEPASVHERAAAVLAAMPAVLLPPDARQLRPERDGLARSWCAAVGADPGDPAAVDLVRRLLVVHADHDLATSTTAVRASAMVHADLYACLLTGLSAIDSPLHGTANVTSRIALEAAVLDPARALGAALAATAPPPGFGHPIYRRRDPRAEYLLAHLRRTRPGPAERAAAVVEEGLSRRGLFPSCDWAMALATHELGVPPGSAATLFAAARMMGWVAHTLEEYGATAPRRRVTGVYTGPVEVAARRASRPIGSGGPGGPGGPDEGAPVQGPRQEG